MAGLYRHRFKLLLATLLGLILGMPLLVDLLVDTAPTFGIAVAMSGGICVMIAAILVVSGTRGARWFAGALLAPSLLIEAGAVFFWPDELLLLHFVLRIAFIAFILGAMLREIFSTRQITFDTVCSSLCVYLLIGIVWENVYAIMETAAPGSIVTVTRTQAEAPQLTWDPNLTQIFRTRYFSFATLTSVGYGDIIPGTKLARMCAITEALVGQIYLLVMVSRLVGLHVSQTMPTPADST
jgi:hypothetical protein